MYFAIQRAVIKVLGIGEWQIKRAAFIRLYSRRNAIPLLVNVKEQKVTSVFTLGFE